jgi:uncharacterized small protein (DUF1192 family)
MEKIFEERRAAAEREIARLEAERNEYDYEGTNRTRTSP